MPILHTIGYGGRKPSELIDALNEYQINWVVDVRLTQGAYLQVFNAGANMRGLLRPSIGYLWLPELGNMYGYGKGLEIYHKWICEREHGWKVLKSLTDRLQLITCSRICLLCAELKPQDCHRAIIATEAVNLLNPIRVTQTKWEVVHIE